MYLALKTKHTGEMNWFEMLNTLYLPWSCYFYLIDYSIYEQTYCQLFVELIKIDCHRFPRFVFKLVELFVSVKSNEPHNIYKRTLETTDHTIRFRSIILKRLFTQKPCDSLSSAGHERTYGNTFYEVHAFNEVQPHL